MEDISLNSNFASNIAMKTAPEHVESLSNNPSETLSPSHREYLLERHGQANLVPLPSEDPLDPYNWPARKKNVNLALVAFHGLMSTGGAVAVVPAFETWTYYFGVSMDTASYLGSAQMITLALGPLFWIPLANRYGRLPIWLLSTLGGGLFNVGCALSRSYATLMVLRIFQAFFISPGIAMGQAVVAESFFAHQRAQKMGIWTLMISIGTPIGPFIMGFVITHLSWRWMFWIMAATNLAQFIGYLFLGAETVYNRDASQPPTTRRRLPWIGGFGRIISIPLTLEDFILPFRLLGDYRVIVATVSYAFIFNFTLVMMTVELPAFFTPLFHHNPQQIGLNFLGLLIGCTLGEITGGHLSDFWQFKWPRRARHTTPAPERRLWLAYPGIVLAITGIVIFLIMLDLAEPMHWTIKPLVGLAIGGFGVQIVTTTAITYCSDCHREIKSSALGVAINFVRCTWGFLGPFWFPYMLDSCGLRGATGVIVGLIVAVSAIPIALLQYLARRS